MIVVFDNTVLSLLLHPEADAPLDPATNAPITRAQDRMAHLVEQLRESDAHSPRWTPENRPSIDTSKPATTGRGDRDL